MNGASAHLQPALRASRLAVLAVFFVNGLVIGTWVVRIPAIKEKLDLGEALLGVALLGAAVGALVAMPLVGALVFPLREQARRRYGRARALALAPRTRLVPEPTVPSARARDCRGGQRRA